MESRFQKQRDRNGGTTSASSGLEKLLVDDTKVVPPLALDSMGVFEKRFKTRPRIDVAGVADPGNWSSAFRNRSATRATLFDLDPRSRAGCLRGSSAVSGLALFDGRARSTAEFSIAVDTKVAPPFLILY
jgi:hypothetical protein